MPNPAPTNQLYADLSCYYDLMCADIDYQGQSQFVHRLHQLLGNQGRGYLDLACGTGPHLRHFLDLGYDAWGVDINQPMLDQAQGRCPQAKFLLQDMARLELPTQVDLVSCFLYSIHYNQNLTRLEETIKAVHSALKPGGLFCFNAVDKRRIDNRPGIKRQLHQGESEFIFQSNWFYQDGDEQQQLQLAIQKTSGGKSEIWRDHHSMVAISIPQLETLLAPYFDVHLLDHNYEKIVPWVEPGGNALIAAVKRD